MKCNSSRRFVCCVHSNSFQRISSIMDLAWPGDRSQVTNGTFLESMKYTNGTPLFWHGGKNNPYPIFLKSWCVYIWLAKTNKSNNQGFPPRPKVMTAWWHWNPAHAPGHIQLPAIHFRDPTTLRFAFVNWIFFFWGGRDNSLVEAKVVQLIWFFLKRFVTR